MDELSCDTARVQIDGLVDGELTPSAAEILQRHIAGCPECARRLQARRDLVAMLPKEAERLVVDDLMRRRLLVGLQGKAKRPGLWWLSAPAAAAIAASLMLFMGVPKANDAGVEEVLSVHLRSLTPGHLTDVESSDRHSVKPWFNGRLAMSPPVPDLSDQNFILVGGRLDYIGEQSVACLVYRRSLHIINLCIWPNNPDMPALPGSASRHGYNLLSWRQDDQTVAMISDLNREELGQFKETWVDRSSDPSNSH
jgi:anti-sigma factor RsiW